MKHSIQLSIILTTHAKNEHFNALLANVLGFDHSRLEIIIVDDSADVVTTQFIERELGKNDYERVYLFTHEESKGRGASLNEALIHASGSLLWAPLRADRLNEALLAEAIRRFKADPAAFWVMDYGLPQEPAQWINAAEESELPDDSCFIWNRNVIYEEQFFFNPFLEQLHGAELALRLKKGNVWQKTDPFFVISDDQSVHAGFSDMQEFLLSALRLSGEKETRDGILHELANVESRISNRIPDDEMLLHARQLLKQGDAARALDIVNKFLKRNPEHTEAIRIKISALEKLRRHVEAAELKYNLQKQPRKPEEQAEVILPAEDAPETDSTGPEPAKMTLSVIIPTTAHGKALLENALVYLEEAVDAAATELIVVDNASIDDTFDYLEQLKAANFLNINVITNQVNKGFAASLNQGIETASGQFILCMHNDVEVPKDSVDLLMHTFEQSPEIGLAVPVVSSTSINAQSRKLATDSPFVLAEKADSCCFMIKNDLSIRFDEQYGLCYFEMEDFCRQLKGQQKKIAVARNTIVQHTEGSTTKLMGFELNPELRWENRAILHRKWNKTAGRSITPEGTIPERFQRLGAPFNPMKPDHEWVNTVQDFLTSEVKTEILRGNWNEDELLTIILTLLIADERELMRTLEDKLNGTRPNSTLLMMFVHYYFNKNIFSRCKHYMDMAEENHPVFDLYRLKILVAEKEFEGAMELMNQLLEYYPSSPELYYLIARMYKKSDEEGEANSFYAMANQLDPIRFGAETSAFELNS